MKWLKITAQITFICALSLIGQLTSTYLSLPLPGNLTGMLILLALLFSGVLREEWLTEGADLLLKFMAFFFIPAGTGLLAHYDLLKASLLPWLAIVMLSTMIVLVGTAKAVEMAIKLKEDSR